MLVRQAVLVAVVNAFVKPRVWFESVTLVRFIVIHPPRKKSLDFIVRLWTY